LRKQGDFVRLLAFQVIQLPKVLKIQLQHNIGLCERRQNLTLLPFKKISPKVQTKRLVPLPITADKDIFVLRAWKADMTKEEIAETLNCAPKEVGSRLSVLGWSTWNYKCVSFDLIGEQSPFCNRDFSVHQDPHWG
jgi:hypothetical protein